MITLIVEPSYIATITSFSGNIDIDNLKPHIYEVQKNEVKKILTIDLYNKIYNDYVSNTLTGLYKTIYDDYVADIIVYFSCVNYLEFKQPDDKSSKTAYEISIAQRYKQLGANSELEFIKYMKTISIPEYKPNGEQTNKSLINWF
jgi:hypothetical protein